MEDSLSLTRAADVDRGARLASALITTTQNVAVVGVFVALFGLGDLPWAYVAVGLLMGLELADSLVARRALRRLRGVAVDRRNLARLRRRDHQLIVFTFVGLPLLVAGLAIDARPANTSVFVVGALTAATLTPGVLTLVRVLRADTWLAVSRLALVHREMTLRSTSERRKPPSE